MFKHTILKFLFAGAILSSLAGGAFAQNAADVKEELDTYRDDVNSGIGVLTSRISTLEDKAKLNLKGDIRVRHEVFNQKAEVGTSRVANRGRSRIRFRFGADKDVNKELFAGFQLATGSTTTSFKAKVRGTSGTTDDVERPVTYIYDPGTGPVTTVIPDPSDPAHSHSVSFESGDSTVLAGDPTSTNQTLSDRFVEKGVFVDQAFLRWTPSLLGNRVSLTGGKMKNPLLTTAIVWDGDTNPEGFTGEVTLMPRTKLRGGWWVLMENSAGKEYGMNVFQAEHGLSILGLDVTAACGYQFVPLTNALVGGTPDPIKNGNLKNAGGVLPDFKVVDGLLQLKRKVGGKDLIVKLHQAHNMNSFDLFSAIGYKNNNENAYAVECMYGAVAGKKDYALNVRWGYIEPNAVLSIFSDSDSEYNNRKYVRAQVGYGLTDGMEFNLVGFGIRRVSYDVLSSKESRQTLYRTQIDFVVKI